MRILFCILVVGRAFCAVSGRVNKYSLGVVGRSKAQGNDAFFILLWEIRDLYSHSNTG